MANLIDSIRRKRKFAKLSRKRLHLWDLSEQQICYIQNYKVCTRSIREALTRYLIEQETGQPLADYDCITHDLVEAKDNATKRFKHVHEIREVCPKHFVFTFVRHPVARIQSCYTNRLLDAANAKDKDRFSIYGITRDTSFEDFVKIICDVPDKFADRHFKSQHTLTHDGDQSVCDFIGKFENLAEGWAQLQERFDLPALPHKNKSHKREKSDTALSQEGKQLLAKRYARDFEVFGYEL
ncbi:MAG: sulfotransferase family protein [Coraliomargarita sp.]